MLSLHRNIFLLCTFVFICGRVSTDVVPVALWNIKGDALSIVPVSSLAKDDAIYQKSLEEVINKKNARILVFAVNKLSLEDFSASEKPFAQNDTIQNVKEFLNQGKYLFLSSVNNPLNQIHEVHCGVQEIVVDQSIDEETLESIPLAFDKSCVVILHITDAGVVGPKEKIFKPSFQKNFQYVGIFTGAKSSWQGMIENRHRGRNLLDYEAPSLSADPNFLNFTGCLLMYAENATLKIDNKTLILPFPPKPDGSACGNISTLLQLNFETSDEKYKSVVVKFNFTNVMGSYSTQITLETGDVITDLNPKDLEAPLDFSYSCKNYVLRNKNRTEPVLVDLIFNRFQVQPFRVNDKFRDSFDCVTWFTVPIWMGILVSLLAIIIINIGVYALFSISTVDRFDDPKGKTISVAAAAD